MPSKTELLAALKGSRDQALERLRRMSPEALHEGVYENGWNGQQIVAHVASIEWTYPRLMDIAKESPAEQPPVPAGEVRRTTEQEAPSLPTRTAQGGIDSYNARQVEKRTGASLDALIEEFDRNRAATIAAVEAADNDLMRRPIRSAGGITGNLSDVIYAVAVDHVMSHIGDISGEGWQGQRW
jgi:DinB superfamily